MNCKNCNMEYTKDMLFCQNCGISLKTNEESESINPDHDEIQETDMSKQKIYTIPNKPQTNYGKKIKALSNIVFGINIFISFILFIGSILAAFIFSEAFSYRYYSNAPLIFVGGFLLGLFLAIMNVIFGYILKIFIYSYGIIVSSHEERQK